MILSLFKFDSVKRPLLYGIILISFLLFSCKEKKADQNAQVNEEATPLNLKQIDLAVVNGKIIDGTGKKAYQGNIFINNDSIVYIGELSNSAIKISKTIDAQGKFVTPGFIDLHAHGDPLSTPEFENFLAMGVTSIVLGQDGESANVKDIETYIHQVNQQNLGVNIIEFVGHGTLRDVIGVGVKAKLSTAELESLKPLLASQLKSAIAD